MGLLVLTICLLAPHLTGAVAVPVAWATSFLQPPAAAEPASDLATTPA